MSLPPVPVVLVDRITAPAVWGLWRPRIVWPAQLSRDLPESGIDGLIVHELAHLKRRDHLIGWMELIAGVVWWWNPLFWFVRSAVREHAELACDAWVISVLPNGRRAYAESLLALSIQAPGLVHPSMAVVGISATTRKALERRLVMIMKGRASLRLTFVGLCSLAAVAAATLPTWAATDQQATPPVVAAAPSTAPATAAPQPQVGSVPRTIRVPDRGQVLTQVPTARRQPVLPTDHLRALVTPTLPDAARALESAYQQDQQALREKFLADLQRLQDELTKAGNLDDAVAVRDYLRRTSAGRGMATPRALAGFGTTPANGGRGGGGAR